MTAAPGAGAAAGAAAWRKAIEVPGLGSLNKGGAAVLESVSCGRVGNCAADGFYKDGSAHFQAFVVSERNGTWHKAIEVPGTDTLNAGGRAGVGTVACASAGNCAAGGSYTDGSAHTQAFVDTQRNGTWHNAIEVPSLATLNADGNAAVTSVRCLSAGHCVAGGFYTDGSGHLQAFVVSQI